MTLQLSDKEAEILKVLIDQRLNQLRIEIHRTDSPFYKAELEKDEPILSSLQDRLSSVPAIA